MVEEMEHQESVQSVYTPGPDAIDLTPSKDGGVLKEIKREGSGSDFPLTGDKVSVHYVGTLLDGTKFDSSRDRGELFEFNLGKGAVIKAWDLGVASMKRGELAVLYCKSEYAYGKAGSPPKIPADATLVFEVELFDWKGEDVSEAKDEGVMKSILKAGEGYQSPKEGATCDIHVVGLLNGVEFENRDVSLVIGEGMEVGVVEGIEEGLKKMKKEEKAKLLVKAKYAYGAEGNSELNIPPSADLEYHVELIKFEKCKESWELDVVEKIEQAEIFKTKGTDFFKAGKLKIALRYYKKLVDYLKNEDNWTGPEGPKRSALLLAGYLNKALCHLKLKEDMEALDSCDEALKFDPKNEKGLFRRGTANLNLQNFDEALKDFKAVLEVDPENKAAKNQIAITSRKIKQLHEKEKMTYAGMFTKFAMADSKKVEEKKSEDHVTEETNNEALMEADVPTEQAAMA